MDTFAQRQVVPDLFKMVPGMKSAHLLNSQRELDKLMKLPQRVVTFLSIDGRMEDPIYMFWKLHRTKVLGHDCHIVFTDIRPDSGWADLEKYFGGTKFGTLFLMRVSENACPSVCPSQRGMYLK